MSFITLAYGILAMSKPFGTSKATLVSEKATSSKWSAQLMGILVLQVVRSSFALLILAICSGLTLCFLLAIN